MVNQIEWQGVAMSDAHPVLELIQGVFAVLEDQATEPQAEQTAADRLHSLFREHPDFITDEFVDKVGFECSSYNEHVKPRAIRAPRYVFFFVFSADSRGVCEA